MTNNSPTIQKGSTHPTISPKLAQVQGHHRNNLVRTVFGGCVVAGLAIAYIVALFKDVKADGLLAVVAGLAGVLLGRVDRGDQGSP